MQEKLRNEWQAGECYGHKGENGVLIVIRLWLIMGKNGAIDGCKINKKVLEGREEMARREGACVD